MKKFFVVFLMILILIQFIRPAKNISTTVSPNDIALHYPLSSAMQSILKKSCYDCHSNNTIYPWYDDIQPVAWWLQNHVNDGKWALNFSEFGSYPAKKQFRKMKGIINEIKHDQMPLNSYLWIHKDAKLSQEQKNIVIGWADSLQLAIKTKNNLADEPEREERD